MRIGLAQINPTLGDFEGNRLKIVEYVQRAFDKKCDLVVFPELALMGYLPNDMLERRSIVDEQLKELAKLQKQIPAGIGVLVGAMTLSGLKKGKPYRNSAVLLERAKKPKYFHKELLPTYDVFDEARHIEKGSIADGFFTFKGKKLLLTICEDIWGWELPGHPTNYLENPLLSLKKNRLDLVINMSASPFTLPKAKDRHAVVAATAKLFKAPVVYVNMVGGQDEVIFDGGSIVVGANGKKLAQSAYFEEDLNLFDLESAKGGFREDTPKGAIVAGSAGAKSAAVEKTRRALVLGIRDFVHKTGFKRIHLGLSGGIDSAVVACLAVDALGPGKVSGFTMPGPFNEPRSKTLGEKLAKNLDIECRNFAIEPAYDTVMKTLHGTLGAFEFGVVNENVQSRLRGLLLMAYSNKESSMLLTTGNKSEYATGYATLYGDMCGGLAPLGDLLKGEIYALARSYNSQRELIPTEIITRPPSAELRPNQKDQDTLPPYDELDSAVRNVVEFQKAAKNETERWILSTLARTEFKRWQAAPILKISGHAFGRGRRMPIAQKAKR
jgi:NAD+ synthase (glutamine-hydrolysing)